MAYTPTQAPTSLEQKREERERREARDRVLAREVGIEIGRRRERERQHKAKERAWERGFIIGLVVAVIFMLIGLYGAERASASSAPKNQRTLHGGLERDPKMPHPNVIRAIIRIGQCEQPAPRGTGYYANIKWNAYPGKTWPGGLGIMQIHHNQFRPKGVPKDPTRATPAQQIRTAWRAYKYYRNIYGVRGGSTFWDCSRKIGFGGVLYDNRTVVWG